MQFHFPSFPLSDPILVFALAMTIFLVLPQLFERMRIPGLIGLIIAGTAIGPSGFGLLDRDATIVLLGTVGELSYSRSSSRNGSPQGSRSTRSGSNVKTVR
ncbi:MAG: hypothetical protein ACODAB_05880 [Gemmatimonadota bacterium]